MLFPNSGRMNVARAARGALLAGDGELDVPPILQAVAFIGDPIDNLQPLSTDLMTTSFAAEFVQQVLGARAQQFDTLCTLGKGIWNLQFSFCVSVTAPVAATLGNSEIVQLRSPDASVADLLRQFRAGGNGDIVNDKNYNMTLGTDGYTIRQSTAATAALEVLSTSLILVAQKLG